MSLIDQLPDSAGIIALWSAACLSAAWSYSRRRDILDPRFCFPLFYAYATSGPYIYFLLTDEIHPGIKVENILPVLLCCAAAILCFSCGASVAMFRLGRAVPHIPPLRSERDVSAHLWIRRISMLLAVLSLGAFAVCAWRLLGSAAGVAKEYYPLHVDETTLAFYSRTSAAAQFSLYSAITVTAYLAGRVRQWPVLVLLAIYALICAAAGERDFVLVAVYWLCFNWRRAAWPTRYSLVAGCMFAVAVIPALRTSGLGTDMLESKDTSVRDLLQHALIFSSNFHVFTNVVSIMQHEDWFLGETFLRSLATFIPGESESKDSTPALWFKEKYDRQRVAGFAFAMDAEGYINFGWSGTCGLFFVWGLFLAYLYRRAAVNCTSFTLFLWIFALMVSIFVIRSDSRTLLKLLIYGALGMKLIWMAGYALAQAGSERRAAERAIGFHGVEGR